MILDTLKNWQRYTWNDKRFQDAFRFLESLEPSVADGKHEIDGDNVYCTVQSYETRSREGHKFEAHRVYADIQFMMTGEESILWAPQPELTVVTPYEPDIEFYAMTLDPTEIVLSAGRFCVLFPQDAHAPCTVHRVGCTVRKAVVKVRVSG
jgi:YhcH/YjgK/YiaL family protein